MFKPSSAQQAYFDWINTGEGNCILEAVAGAGKTTTILEGISRMKGRVWFGVYNKKMADEIKEKIAGRRDLRERKGLYTSTFHSAGYSALRFAFGKHAALNIDDKKTIKIAQAIVDAGRTDLEPLVNGVAGIVSMAKNRGIGALTQIGDMSAWIEMIEHFDLDNDLPGEFSIDQVVKFAQVVLKRGNENLDIIDFDDMVYLPLQRNLRMLTHEWVLVDEAQDTNPTRRALARKLLAPNGRMVAVGDPHQAIFGFTGADNDSLEQIARAFDAKYLPLTVTYRCPKAIVSHAQQWVSHIEAHDSAPEGLVSTLEYKDLLTEITAMPRTEYGETAMLCRYNKYLVNLCFKLIRHGVPAKIEGRSVGEGLIKLATRWKAVKTLNGLETKLKEFLEREVKKAMDKGQEDRADRITDQVETLLVIMDRAREQNIEKVAELKSMITDLFDDNTAGKGLLTLCSAHKSKGLEWNKVYLLGRDQLMPSNFARQPWMVAQEENLIYVAVTRAKQHLVEVVGLVDESAQTER